VFGRDLHAVQVADCSLGGTVAPDDVIGFKVDDDAGAGHDVGGTDAVLFVLGFAEQLATSLVEVVVVEFEFLGGLVDARVLDLDVDDLELVVADAVAQIVLVAV